MRRALGLVAATAICALGAAAPASAAADVQQAQSGNWSGYVAGGGTGSTQFKNVSGSWVVPSTRCATQAGSAYSAFWVGLGGAGDADSLEQAGTEANCTATGTASYYAWYELVPAAPVRIDLPVAAGDRITTKVAVSGSSVSISVTDATSGRSFSKTLTMSDPDVSSAEWIAEAPSACGESTSDCTPLTLADFGSVRFSSASATDSAGHSGSISDSAWSATAVALSPSASSDGFQGASLAADGSAGGATPSSLASDGSAFSVAYTAEAGAGQSAGGDGAGSGGNGSGGYGVGGYGYGGYGGGGYGGYGGGGTGSYGGGGTDGYGGYGAYGTDGYGYGYGGYAFAPLSARAL